MIPIKNAKPNFSTKLTFTKTNYLSLFLSSGFGFILLAE
jgi:hypothetical protein